MPRGIVKEPWHPADYQASDIRAIQALVQGDATPQEQKRAIKWIVEVAAGTYDEPFRPGTPDMVNYLLGRRSVGLAIVKLSKLKVEMIK